MKQARASMFVTSAAKVEDSPKHSSEFEDIKKKYRGHNENRNNRKSMEDMKMELLAPVASVTPTINFRGMISSCFENHMGAFSEMQSNQVTAMLADAKKTEVSF